MFETSTGIMAAILVSGIVVGCLGTVIGFGGGFLMVPLLHLVFHVPMHQAVAASLLAICPSALLSTIVGFRRGLVDGPVAMAMEVPTAVMTVVGSLATASVPETELRSLFGFIVGSVGLRLVYLGWMPGDVAAGPGWLGRFKDLEPTLERELEGHPPYRVSLPLAGMLGVVAGFLAGLLGIGGGFMKTPVMVHVFGIPAAIAAPTGLAMITVTAFIGAVTHHRLGHLDLRLGLLVAAGFFAGAIIANTLDRSLSETTRRRGIALALLGSGLFMLFRPGAG